MGKVRHLTAKDDDKHGSKPGRPTSFTVDQQACLDGYLTEYNAEIRAHDPNLKLGSNAELLQWKNKTTELIIKHSSFKGEVKDEKLKGVSSLF